MDALALVKTLTKKNLKIATAESCTGGLLAASIIAINGASNVIDLGMVTYSNDQKVKQLNIDMKIINTNGAVSEVVALLMAKGIKSEANSNIGVGISGIAGPTGGSLNKPVGMVCIGIVIDNYQESYTIYLENKGREYIIKETVKNVIKRLNELLTT